MSDYKVIDFQVCNLPVTYTQKYNIKKIRTVMGKLHKIDTPSLLHTTNSDWQHVYEPAEDTHLLLDALEMDLEFILSRKPNICLELGSGSGIIITALNKLLNSSTHCLALDINRYACDLTQKTSLHNNANVDVIEGDMTCCIRDNTIDLVVFNPPYVVTSTDELESKDHLTRSWAGGINGRQVIDRFLQSVRGFLDLSGFGYLLLLKENDPDNVIDILTRKKFRAHILSYRKIRGEELYVVKFEARVT